MTVHNPFVLPSYTMHTRFYWLVPQYGVNNYCILCTVKAKKVNKNLQQRTLSGFITIPSVNWDVSMYSALSRKKAQNHHLLTIKAVVRKTFDHNFMIWYIWIWVIDWVWGQDGWILAKLSSFFVCLWTETKSRSINSQKKERGQYPAILTEQTWSIKDLLYGFWGNFSSGIQRVVPSGQDGSILPSRVANHSARFGHLAHLWS